ncbi:MAG: hypothetical protein JW795_08385 [Chitinivibrionales bacterium]|nr:hypothetical protein [Chitinivibrionales bacterium]
MFSQKLLWLLLPFLYILVFIIAPIKLFDTNYLWSILVAFWIPIVLMGVTIIPKVSQEFRSAFFITAFLMLPVTFVFEYLCLYLDIWNFFEGKDRLCGVKIFNAPLEEFLFWFGATPLCNLVYLYFHRTLYGGEQ